jgi:hypothetical protein
MQSMKTKLGSFGRQSAGIWTRAWVSSLCVKRQVNSGSSAVGPGTALVALAGISDMEPPFNPNYS